MTREERKNTTTTTAAKETGNKESRERGGGGGRACVTFRLIDLDVLISAVDFAAGLRNPGLLDGLNLRISFPEALDEG